MNYGNTVYRVDPGHYQSGTSVPQPCRLSVYLILLLLWTCLGRAWETLKENLVRGNKIDFQYEITIICHYWNARIYVGF